LDDRCGVYTLLVNPSGGLVGGDHLTIRATVGAGAHVLFSTPSANRIYRSSVEVARQTMQLDVGADAIVEWVPETAIPYAGSRYAQTFHIRVACGGVLWFWEAVASGRIARGERWAFKEFSSHIRIETAAGGKIVERMVVVPGRSDDGGGLASAWNYVASAFLVSDAVPDEVLAGIEEEAATRLESPGAEVLGGMSRPAAPGLALKIVAHTGESLKDAMEGVWGVVRRKLWNRSLPSLRKY
jgi:urease accessory protein